MSSTMVTARPRPDHQSAREPLAGDSGQGRSLARRYLFAALVLCFATPALAQQKIGAASIVLNQVNGTLPSGVVEITQGNDVFRDEGVRTGANSSAKLVFLDNTNVSLGPLSTVKLDRFVYAGADSSGAIVVNLAKGAFRFATGNADKRAYTITTPTAVLSVRGTVFTVLSAATKTVVVLEEGRLLVCTRGKKRRCIELSSPGERAIVTLTSAAKDNGPDPTAPVFASLCEAAAGLCQSSPYTELAEGGAVLCGR